MSEIGKSFWKIFSNFFHIFQVIFSINGTGPALELNCQNISMNTLELSEHSEMVIGNNSLEIVVYPAGKFTMFLIKILYMSYYAILSDFKL